VTPFALEQPTAATLEKFTGRTQRSGPDEVPAVTIHLRFAGLGNGVLDMIAPRLLQTLYEPKGGDAQTPVEGVPELRPILRCDGIGRISPPAKFEGWLVIIEHGPRGEDGAIHLSRAKIDEFHFDLRDGAVDMECRVGTAAVEAEDVGLLWSLQKQPIAVSIRAPKPGASAAPPAPPPAAAKDPRQGDMLEEEEPDATAVFAGMPPAGPVLVDRDSLPEEQRGLYHDRWIIRDGEEETEFEDRGEAEAELRALRQDSGLDPDTGAPQPSPDSDGAPGAGDLLEPKAQDAAAGSGGP
jgi:hypothetical protein